MHDLDDLVRRSRERDREAFGLLMTQLEGLVVSVLRQRIRDEHDVLEVANDTFTHAWFGLPKLEKPENFRSWLVAIAARRALMYHRERMALKRRRADATDLTEPADDAATPMDSAVRAELRDALRLLTAEQAALLDERYFQDLTLREIAEPRALTIDQVWRELGKALERLADRLRDRR